MSVNDVCCAVSLSGTVRSLKITVQEAAFGGNGSLQPADPSIAPAAQRSVIHTSQKVPAILKDWHRKEVRGQRSGEHGG